MSSVSATRSQSSRLSLAWFDGRLLFGVVLVAVSTIGGLVFWNATRETVPVVVASTDLFPGHILQASDLNIAEVKVDGELAALSIPGEDLNAVIGQSLSVTVHAGEMLVRPDLASGSLIGPDEVGITVPVDAEAVYAGMRPGDAVTVLATRDVNSANSQTITLLERVDVYEISREPGRLAVSRGSDAGTEERGVANVTLIVPRAEAERLAHAVVTWRITLAILPPGPAQESGP